MGWIFRFAAWLLTLVAGVIALRETMGFDTLKALVTAVLGLLVYVAASILLGIFFFGPVSALTNFQLR